jgi:hypothetical protein
MKVRITVETTFEDGNIKRRDISRLFRARDKLEPESLGLRLDEAEPESLGLRLDEAKNLLTLLQEAVVQDQIDEALKANRTCSDCGNLRTIYNIHDDRSRILDTLDGRFRVNSPRLRQCLCQATSVMTNTVLPSLVVDLFPERATAELMRLQAELG